MPLPSTENNDMPSSPTNVGNVQLLLSPSRPSSASAEILDAPGPRSFLANPVATQYGKISLHFITK